MRAETEAKSAATQVPEIYMRKELNTQNEIRFILLLKFQFTFLLFLPIMNLYYKENFLNKSRLNE